MGVLAIYTGKLMGAILYHGINILGDSNLAWVPFTGQYNNIFVLC